MKPQERGQKVKGLSLCNSLKKVKPLKRIVDVKMKTSLEGRNNVVSIVNHHRQSIESFHSDAHGYNHAPKVQKTGSSPQVDDLIQLMSPTSGARVQNLMTRFEGTILKAHKTLNGKVLTKRNKGYEELMKIKEDREKQRKAARDAIEKITKTVEFNDTFIRDIKDMVYI